MQKTGTPAAAKATALMIAAGIRKSMFLTSKFVENDSGKYYEPVVTGGGRLPADELLQTIDVRKEVMRLVKSGEIKVSAEEESDYANGNGASGDAPPEEPFDGENMPF